MHSHRVALSQTEEILISTHATVSGSALDERHHSTAREDSGSKIHPSATSLNIGSCLVLLVGDRSGFVCLIRDRSSVENDRQHAITADYG